MAEPRVQVPVLLVVAEFSQSTDALAAAADLLEHEFGPIAFSSLFYDFVQTSYYEPSMGPGLRKRFLVFEELVQPDRLPEIKLRTNAIEADFASKQWTAAPRPINLDPGFLSLGKFLLATTKDQSHRIYLRDGIFAEVTLRFRDGAYDPWPWTYADYQLPFVRDFLRQARDFYKVRLRSQKAS